MTAIPMTRRVDYLELISRILTLGVLIVTVVAAFTAPLLAISWSKLPFPGFLLEQTLVVNDLEGPGWTGQALGIDYPQGLVRVGGQSMATPMDYDRALSGFGVGEDVSIFTVLPSGEASLYPAVKLTQFPLISLVRLFWIPYIVGLAYLAIGIWIYRARGMKRPGRTLAFFCFCSAISCMLFFDASTTHVVTVFWVAALAQLGGALISLGLRFPEEWKPVSQRPWLLGVPYIIALAITGWALLALGAPNRWAYIPTRYTIYLYMVIGVILFLATVLNRARNSSSATIRRQARVVLLGSGLAFGPLALWFVATVFWSTFTFDVALLLPPLILFPLSVALAILRYRLLEMDTIVNRTIFYGGVTAILAGVISVTMSLTQKFFLTVTGEKSDVAAVITTLVVVSAFEPIKARVRGLVERTFKESPDQTRNLKLLGEQVNSFLVVSDAEQIAGRLLEEAARALQAQSGLLSLVTDGRLEPVHAYGNWRGEAWMSVPLVWEGEHYGLISLGPRLPARQYSRQECIVLEQVARQVAGAVHLGRTWQTLSSASAGGVSLPDPSHA